MTPQGAASEAIFAALLRHPGRVLLPLAALLVLALIGLTDLRKDTRSDAFLAPDNPALVYRDLIRERFGLSDPLLIALVLESGPAVADADALGIYRPDILAFVRDLTER